MEDFTLIKGPQVREYVQEVLRDEWTLAFYCVVSKLEQETFQ